MGKIKQEKNPKGSVIFFNEDDHKYYDKNKNYYNSTTRIIHSLFPKFEKEKMAYLTGRKQLMKENGYSDVSEVPVPLCMQRRNQLMEDWDENKERSCDIGNAIHRYAECRLLNIPNDYKRIFSDNDRIDKLIKVLDPFIDNLLKEYDVLYTEKIIFTPYAKLAGTVDIIMQNKKSGNKAIFDWKTNAKGIKTKDSYGKKGLLFLDHIENSNYFHYALQLNIYRWILNNEGYGDYSKCEMGLFHINTRKVNGHMLPFMNYETEKIIEYTRRLKGRIE